jgi:hypothetical protein
LVAGAVQDTQKYHVAVGLAAEVNQVAAMGCYTNACHHFVSQSIERGLRRDLSNTGFDFVDEAGGSAMIVERYIIANVGKVAFRYCCNPKCHVRYGV